MRPAQVLKVRISTTPERLKGLLNALYESSTMHVEGVGDVEEFKKRGVKPASVPGLLEEVRNLKKELLQIHSKREWLKQRKFIKPGFREKMGAERRAVVTIPWGIDEEMAFVREKYKEIMGALAEPVRRIDEQMGDVENIRELLKQFEPLSPFSIPMRILRGESAFDVRAVITREPEYVEGILQRLPVGYASRPLKVKKKKSDWIYVIYLHRRDRDLLVPLLKRRLTVEYLPPREELLRAMEKYEIGGEDLRSVLQRLEERLWKSEEFLKEVAGIFDKRWKQERRYFRATLEELNVLEEKLLGIGRGGNTRYLAFIWGWVEKKGAGRLKRIVAETTGGEYAIDFTEPAEDEEPPILLKNRGVLKDLQGLVEMYGMPRYRSVDPTLPVSLFFVLFIGLMIGDAGYGLVIFLLSLIFHFTLGKDNPKLGAYARVGLIVGALTIISGLAMGGFFGDLVPRFFYSDPTRPLYSAEIFGVHFPVDPMKEPMKIFALALILGIIQMNVGFVLGFYQRAALQRNVKGAITGYISWFLIEVGGGAMLGDYILNMWSLNRTQLLIFLTIFTVGLVLLMMESGVFAFFDLEGFVGDWLSYSRILALGLATAGMAIAINLIAQMLVPGGGVLRAIFMAISLVFLLFAHLLNTGLQALGAIVHSLRLQYSEFMGKFYEGDGRPFRVFGRERLYTDVKEKRFIFKEVR